MEQDKHVCCSTDDNYVQHCGAMLCSLLESSSSKFVIHVLCTEGSLSSDGRAVLKRIVEERGSKCEFNHVDESMLTGVKFREKRPLTYAAYYRILLASLFGPEIEKIFYLDCDIIVLKDISSIFELDISGYALAAVLDITNPCDLQRMQLSIPYEKCFFCSGVMLINLNYWREHGSEEKLLYFSKKERHVFLHDQDALNAVFYDKWFRLPPKWGKFNEQVPSTIKFLTDEDKIEYIHSPMLIHYIVKPWVVKNVRYSDEYWHYVKKAGFNATKHNSKLTISITTFLSNVQIACDERNILWLYGGLIIIVKLLVGVKRLVMWPFKKS